MYTISAQKTQSGYDLFRDGKLLASPKTEGELESQLNFYGILEGIYQNFIARLQTDGRATEEMPEIRIRQLDPDSPPPASSH
jgi:hypothetical protein